MIELHPTDAPPDILAFHPGRSRYGKFNPGMVLSTALRTAHSSPAANL